MKTQSSYAQNQTGIVLVSLQLGGQRTLSPVSAEMRSRSRLHQRQGKTPRLSRIHLLLARNAIPILVRVAATPRLARPPAGRALPPAPRGPYRFFPGPETRGGPTMRDPAARSA